MPHHAGLELLEQFIMGLLLREGLEESGPGVITTLVVKDGRRPAALLLPQDRLHLDHGPDETAVRAGDQFALVCAECPPPLAPGDVPEQAGHTPRKMFPAPPSGPRCLGLREPPGGGRGGGPSA